MSARGLSKRRLARMHEVMARHVEHGAVPGVVTALSRGGEIYVDAIGGKTAAGGEPLQRDTIFRIASMTKPVTAVAAMILVEECRLRLDDPVDWVLPELAALAALPLMHQPGERWLYHTGSDVLGVLIARAADQPLETFFRERIFDPLGMKDTGFSVPVSKLDRLATAYGTDSATGAMAVFDDARASRWSRPPAFAAGGGGLVSTVDDHLAFGRMLLDKGRHGAERILSRPSVELMTTDQITPGQKAASPFTPGFWDSRGWGFGVSIVTRRDDVSAVPGRYGWDGGYGTSWASDPAEDLVAILMTQRLWTSPSPPAVYLDFWTSTYQALDD